MDSKPTGESNLALPKAWLNKFKPKSIGHAGGSGAAGAVGGKTQLGKEFSNRTKFEESIDEPQSEVQSQQIRVVDDDA